MASNPDAEDVGLFELNAIFLASCTFQKEFDKQDALEFLSAEK